jgi:hypothetical protein
MVKHKTRNSVGIYKRSSLRKAVKVKNSQPRTMQFIVKGRGQCPLARTGNIHCRNINNADLTRFSHKFADFLGVEHDPDAPMVV